MVTKQNSLRRERKEHRVELLVSAEVADSWKRHALESGISVGEFIRQSIGMDGKVRARVKRMMNPTDREAY